MYYKIATLTDLLCLEHHLKITMFPTEITNMAPILEHLHFNISILEDTYDKNELSELKGGFVAFFPYDECLSLEYSMKMLLLRYHLEADDFESDYVLTTITKENTSFTWHSRLYIMSDFQIVLVFPIIEERRS
ncbi:MAG: hypothetical protein E7261_10950 [Lachnospiraceae bacterium]|nr:hypothetical protein [Lachnospiraceae bacterium]